jgi:hypothetical protein
VKLWAFFEFEGKEYIALITDDGTSTMFTSTDYKETSEEEFELIDIDDDEEFKKVVEEFEKLTVEEIDPIIN